MNYQCTNCNYNGVPKEILAGNNFVSLALWTILPSLYLLWELKSLWPSLMQDSLAALQSMQGLGADPIDIALSIPGPAYSIWRRIKKKYVCANCGK